MRIIFGYVIYDDFALFVKKTIKNNYNKFWKNDYNRGIK